MRILSVYAHEDARSLTAALRNTAEQVLVRAGHQVVTSDLYGLGFQPVAQKWDFSTLSGGHYNYMFEQQAASRAGGKFAPDVLAEINKLHEADMVLFHFPLWWGGPPAILKGWFDRILAMGFAWDGEHIFENGKLRGKRAFCVVTTGEPASYYQSEGVQKNNVRSILQPVLHGTLAFCGFDVIEPHIVHGVTSMQAEQAQAEIDQFASRMSQVISNPEFYKL
ncbi:MAG: NAD(P)H-dependent oxidoreductase [bacterium]|nr:NAD(P)H-dependent oxidoreductase [bacterium]